MPSHRSPFSPALTTRLATSQMIQGAGTSPSSLRLRPAASVLGLVLACLISRPVPAAEEFSTDLLIVGGTESGWAAAIQAARLGVPATTIVHDGHWLGGQFTEQALACVDENKGVGKSGWGVDWHPMKRSFHRSGLFLELMDRIEAFNTQKYGSPMPGRPYHGPSTFRPAEAEAVFREMLQPYLDSGQVRFITNHYPVAADVDRTQQTPLLTGLHFAPVDKTQADLHIRSRITIDASDWGEAIQVSGAGYECGPDPQSRYAEPSAPVDLSENPINEMNPITWAMIVEQADHPKPVARPTGYDDRNFTRTSRLSLAEMKGLAWDRPVKLGSIPHWPGAGTESPRQLSIFTVRRIVDGNTSKDRRTSILLNYMLGQDYPLERLPKYVINALEATESGASQKNIVEMTRHQRQIIFDDAKRHSLSLLYHLQNFVHERADDKTNSFRHFRLSTEFGTPDHLPPKPYIRESLRLKAMYMMREQDGRNADGFTKDLARERFARVLYPDGLFCWQFHYDFHRTGRAYLKNTGDHLPWGNKGPWIDYEKTGRNTRYVSDRSLFPMRSLIPVQTDGLLGAQKNLGYSSIVCAAIRLHDQCIAVGQAAGAVAAVALKHQIQPRVMPYDRSLIEQVRHALCGSVADGEAMLLWPYRDLACEHPHFVAINRLAAMRILPQHVREVDFRPDEPASNDWKNQTTANAMKLYPSTAVLEPTVKRLTRGEFCTNLWKVLQHSKPINWQRSGEDDADGDGIPDIDDPTLFTTGPPVEWKIEPPSPSEDGLPELSTVQAADAVRVNFTTPDSPPTKKWEYDTGKQFDESRGFGWRDNAENSNRRRRALPENIRDTFVFTRSANIWEYAVDNGRYKVSVCLGDARHNQQGQQLDIEGHSVVDDQSSAAGRFIEVSRIVSVSDGRLTLRLGPQKLSCNTCLNWIIITPHTASTD